MKLPKVRELVEAVKALATGPYTSKFPKVGHTPFPAFRGQPVYDPDRCVGCLACEEVCPAEAIGHQDITEGVPRRVLYHYTDTCIFCGSCEAACIADHQGIRLSTQWELSFFDRKNESSESIEKELQLCEACGRVIACKDHLKWIAERIGELTFSSPTLYQSRLRGLGILDENIAAALREGFRSDRMKTLCARCRRDTTLTTP
jgi:formate hydrogenlyase subunit 6/NADH:ubiquinone oxidoreductase subunit I